MMVMMTCPSLSRVRKLGFIVEVPNCVFTTHRIKHKEYYGMAPRHGMEHEIEDGVLEYLEYRVT